MPEGMTTEVAAGSQPLGATVAPQAVSQQQGSQTTESSNQAGANEPRDLESKLATTGNGKNFIVPRDAFKRAKDEAREKGRKEALDSLVRELGLSSLDEFKGLLQGVKGANSGKAKQQEKSRDRDDEGHKEDRRQLKPPTAEKGNNPDKLYREREKWQRTYETMNQKLSHESRQRKNLEQALEAKDAEMALMSAAFSAGIRDDICVDVAIRALTKHVENLSEQDQAKFDEKKFFEGLREAYPQLFGEVVRPANTGVGGSHPSPPKPGAMARTEAANTQKDARKMSSSEFQEHLRSRGLNIGI